MPSDQQLKLLGQVVSPKVLLSGETSWAIVRGGYSMRINEVTGSRGGYQWSVCLLGNVAALSQEGFNPHLDGCIIDAHQAIYEYVHEVQSVHKAVMALNLFFKRKLGPILSRYRRSPVI